MRAFLLCLIFLAPLVHAGQETGNDLLRECTSDSQYDQGFCYGQIAGYYWGQSVGFTVGMYAGSVNTVPDFDKSAAEPAMRREATAVLNRLRHDGRAQINCVPNEANLKQLRDILVKWMESNPEKRADPITAVMNGAFRNAFGWPCPGISQ